jgi:hypothetical protein
VGRPSLRHAGLVGLFFLAATAFYTFPLVFRPRETLMVGLGDYPTETSMVAWNARQTFRDPRGLFQTPFYYPYGSGVAYQQSAFFTGLLAAPLLALGVQPIHAVNLLLIAGLVASGVLMYHLAFSITGRVGPSLLAGVVFAYFPNRMDHLGQFTYQQAALYPLVMGAVYRFVLAGRWRDALLAGAALWAQTLSSLYNAYALVLLLAALTVALLLLRPHRLTWPAAGKAAVVGAALALALWPFAGPYLAVHRELGFQRTLDESQDFGMDLLSLLDPGVFSRFYAGRLVSLDRPEGGLFPGFVTLGLAAAAGAIALRDPDRRALPAWARGARWLLAAAAVAALGKIALAVLVGKPVLALGDGVVVGLRRLTLAVNVLPALALGWILVEGRRRLRGPLTAREWTLVLLFLCGLAYLICLAPTIRVAGQPRGPSLFRWMYLHLPGGSAFRAPGRWSLVFVLPLAVLAALGARAVAERLPRRWGRVAAAALLAGLLAEYALSPLPWRTLPPRPPVYDWLAAEPGEFAVLQVPMYERASDAWAMLWALHHGKWVVNGHGGFPLPTWVELVRAAQAGDAARLSAALQAIYPLRYVIAHPGLLGSTWGPAWQLMRDGRVAALERVRTFGADEVYAVAATPQVGHEIRRHFRSDVVRRRPWAEYTLRLTGEDAEVERRVEVRFNGRLLRTHAGGGPARLFLPPPYPAADRNELAFLHAYRVRPAAAGTAAYRIGRTGTQSPVDIEVRSAGMDDGNLASIRVNGHELVSVPRRGYWVAALAPADGRVLGVECFDTARTVAESGRLAAYLEGLPPGTVVAVAVLDEAGGRLTEPAVRALQAVGARGDLRGTFRLAHAVVGVRGARAGEAVEAWGKGERRLVVGRARAVDVSLEAFELR